VEITTDIAALAGYERDVRAFAKAFPTPNVLRMLALCESGRISWVDAYALARKALDDGLAQVQ